MVFFLAFFEPQKGGERESPGKKGREPFSFLGGEGCWGDHRRRALPGKGPSYHFWPSGKEEKNKKPEKGLTESSSEKMSCAQRS